jgi:hypothetical protein
MNCCDHGAVVLPQFPVAPPALTAMLGLSHMHVNLRAYNMAMCMASVGHQSKGLAYGSFVLGGKTYHRIGSLQPRAEAAPAFAQIYVLDVQSATDRRLGIFGGVTAALRRDVLAQLHALMLSVNPLMQQFVAAARGDIPHLVWRCSDDISTMQVGALVAASGSRRDIVVERSAGPLMFIHDGHRLYHPLAYPLLFPCGTDGWHEDMVVVNAEGNECCLMLRLLSHPMAVTAERRLSLTEWGRFYIMHRGAVATHWQRCGCLAMEFYCDLWAQVEARQCSFHRLPQQQLKYSIPAL